MLFHLFCMFHDYLEISHRRQDSAVKSTVRMQYFERSAIDGNYTKIPIFPEDEESQKGEPRGPEVGAGAAQGLAAPPCEEGAHSPLSPPFLRVRLCPENLSPRG